MELITAAEARAHLRVEADYPDDQVVPYLAAAISAVQKFLGCALYATFEELQAGVVAGTAGAYPIVMTPDIRAGILLAFGNLHDNREDAGPRLLSLPSASRALLSPHRVGVGL
jgi:hypothetical protein